MQTLLPKTKSLNVVRRFTSNRTLTRSARTSSATDSTQQALWLTSAEAEALIALCCTAPTGWDEVEENLLSKLSLLWQSCRA